MADEHIRSEICRNDHHAESRGSSRNQPGTRCTIYPTYALGCSTLNLDDSATRNKKPEKTRHNLRISKHAVDS